jgi:hypothetical protein
MIQVIELMNLYHRYDQVKQIQDVNLREKKIVKNQKNSWMFLRSISLFSIKFGHSFVICSRNSVTNTSTHRQINNGTLLHSGTDSK